jgi:hypothetical protein
MEFLSPEMWVEWVWMEGSKMLFAHVSMRYQLDVQMEMIRRQLDIMRLEFRRSQHLGVGV